VGCGSTPSGSTEYQRTHYRPSIVTKTNAALEINGLELPGCAETYRSTGRNG
jgi:hypothetical protein